MASTVSTKIRIFVTAFILSIAFAHPARADDRADKIEAYQLLLKFGQALASSGVNWKAEDAAYRQENGGATPAQIALAKQLAGNNLLDLINEAQNSSLRLTSAGKTVNSTNSGLSDDKAEMKSAPLLSLTYWNARSKSGSDQKLLTQGKQDQAVAQSDYEQELGEIEQKCDATADMKTLCQNASTALDGDRAEFASGGVTGSDAATVLKAALGAK